MFVKINKVKRGDQTYYYANLVESYRRESDGRPTHRVVTKIGRVSEQLARNLQTAFRAAEEGRAVVCTEDVEELARPVAHHRYLDVAVLLRLWQRFGLDEVAAQVADDDRRNMPFGDVFVALVLHRCIDPGSKIQATRWYADTALPELLGHKPSAFNNTRLHRALDRLAEQEAALQQLVARQVVDQRGDYTALFIDLTDTWFVNAGCDLAEKRKTKEGLWRFKVGIALLCTPEGFPLRWKVVPGRAYEADTVLEVGQWLQQCDLPVDKPVVVDRIMGTLKPLSDMKRQGIRYVTALRASTLDHFASDPDDAFFKWTEGIDIDQENAIEQAERLAREAGMIPVRRELWARDLGVVEPSLPDELKPSCHIARTQEALSIARRIQDMLDSKEVRFLKQAAAALDLSQARAGQLRRLLKLHPTIQRRIDEGDNIISVSRLGDFARLPLEEQMARYEQTCADAPQRECIDAVSRVVVYFHPRGFVNYRRKMKRYLAEIETALADLNRRLTSPHSKRNEASIEREIRSKMLKPRGLETYVDIDIQTHQFEERSCYRVAIHPNDTGRRAALRDGFFFLAAHPDVDLGAESLSELYSAKNIIECDFKVIKSTLQLRPVYHRTDPKVRAHVSLCMLALLLHRALEHEVANGTTASQLLKALGSVCLNPVELGDGVYTLTKPTDEQLAILKQLEMEDLVQPDELPARVTAR